MLFVAGLVLLALGLLSGVFLLLFPLGVVAGSLGMALWLLFPVFTVLVLQGGGVMAPCEDTTPLWYVLVVGIVLGAAGLASHGRGAGGTKPAA